MVGDKMVRAIWNGQNGKRTKWYGQIGTDKMAQIKSSINQLIPFPLKI